MNQEAWTDKKTATSTATSKVTFRRRRLASVALSLLLAGALAGCSLGRTEVANPDEEVYGTTVVMPPGNRVGSVPDPVITIYKQRVPNQYREKPLWTF